MAAPPLTTRATTGGTQAEHRLQHDDDREFLNAVVLADLSDVEFAVSPTDGQVLKFDGASGLWKPGTDLTSTGGSGGSWQRAPVHVYKDGSTYYAYSRTGGLITSGTVAHSVINAAITNAESGGGGDVFLLAGIYSLTGTILGGAHVRLTGEKGTWDTERANPKGTILSAVTGFPTASGSAMYQAVSTSTKGVPGAGVAYIGFDGNAIAPVGIKVANKDAIVDSVIVKQCKEKGIWLANGNLTGQDNYVAMSIRFPSVDMAHATGSVGIAVEKEVGSTAAGMTDCEIIVPRVFRCKGAAIRGGRGLGGGGGLQVQGGHVTNSGFSPDAENVAQVDLAVSPGMITGMYLDSPAQGPWLHLGGPRFYITNCFFRAGGVFSNTPTTRWINVAGGGLGVIANNIAESNSDAIGAAKNVEYGVFFGSAITAGRHVKIVGNSFEHTNHLKNRNQAEIEAVANFPTTTA
ncbi:MAG: hypothetical protein H0W51_03145 [Euzebyales bacterium]|nr:hypothetical protein [Euzebyales bacterium]